MKRNIGIHVPLIVILSGGSSLAQAEGATGFSELNHQELMQLSEALEFQQFRLDGLRPELAEALAQAKTIDMLDNISARQAIKLLDQVEETPFTLENPPNPVEIRIMETNEFFQNKRDPYLYLEKFGLPEELDSEMVLRRIFRDDYLVFGEDDRIDIGALKGWDPTVGSSGLNGSLPGNAGESEKILELSRSICAIVPSASITFLPGANLAVLTGDSMESRWDVCANLVGSNRVDKFRKDISVAIGTAFRVGDSVLATASHCFEKHPLAEVSFVFGYVNSASPVDEFEKKLSVPIENVINGRDCEIVFDVREVRNYETRKGNDLALVRVKSALPEGENLKISKMKPVIEDGVFTIGTSWGTPLKLSPNGFVRNVSGDFFTTNLDAFATNSGGPVFSIESNEVVGVLVSGDHDFKLFNDGRGGCNYLVYVPESESRKGIHVNYPDLLIDELEFLTR